MIEDSALVFPNNVAIKVKEFLDNIDPDVPTFLRPIRNGDPVQAWAVVPSIWTPNEDSWEFVGSGAPQEPTLGRYVYSIQAFNQDMDQERGLSVASVMASKVRNLLSRSLDVRAALATLFTTDMGCTERFRRGFVDGQRFINNEVEGVFLHMSTLSFVVETEISG